MKTRVYVSYSHQDYGWMVEIVKHLAPLKRDISLWSDAAILPGADWKKEIESALNSADIAILLLSPSYLASRFIAEIELPGIIRLSESEKLLVIPIIVSPCSLENTVLSQFQSLNPFSEPLSSQPIEKRDRYLRKLAEMITERSHPSGETSGKQVNLLDYPDYQTNIFFKAEAYLKASGEIK
jgi:internalin A